MVSTQEQATKKLDALSRAFAGLASPSTSVTIDPKDLPGGAQGPIALLLSKSTSLKTLQEKDVPGNTNALFLERLGDALAESGDKAAAAKAYGRARAAGSKSKELAGKLSKVGS